MGSFTNTGQGRQVYPLRSEDKNTPRAFGLRFVASAVIGAATPHDVTGAMQRNNC